MIKKTAKSIRSIFLRSQIVASLIVMGVVTTILTFLLLSYANYMDHQRVIALSQSIETQTRIAKTSRHLQHAITQIVYGNSANSVIIYSKTADKIIAANSMPSGGDKKSWFLANKQVKNLAKNSLAEGRFGINILKIGQRYVSIFPLAPPIREINTNNVIIGTKWPTPEWHDTVKKQIHSLGSLWYQFEEVLVPGKPHNFYYPRDQYAGAIVIETGSNWITTVIIQGAAIISILMALSIFAVLSMLSRVLHINVLSPLQKFIEVIGARRTGDVNTRVPYTNIIEFDELARQWNSLLDYRDVAQSQNMVLSTLLEHVPVGIDVTDTHSNIEYANPSFLQMTGYTLAEVIGQTPDSLLTTKKSDAKALKNSQNAITNGQSWSGEMVYSRKDGSDLICNTTLVPIYGRDSQLQRLISVRLDITNLKNDQKSLIAAKINAEKADKAKSEFLTNMSHELRTPLNAIIGFSELMAEQKLGPMGSKDYVEFSKLIEASSRTLLSSINLILDLSRFDAERVQYNETVFDLCEMLQKLIESKKSGAHSYGIEINQDFSCNCQVKTDQRMLHQSLSSLLCNAIRYNRQGGQVMVSVVEKDKKAIITIADNGIGISEENLTKVTEPFFRVNNDFDRMKDGAGLGLTLANKFAAEMKLDLKIDSELDKGTTITMVVPIAKSQKQVTENKKDTANSNQAIASHDKVALQA